MIASFAVTNFKSFKDRVEIKMQKSNLVGHSANIINLGKGKKYLKSAVIYGPNASGKSNLLLTIRALEYMVGNSSQFKPNQTIGPYEPYKLDKKTANGPVTLEISFFANDVLYDYLISFSAYQIEREEMFFYPKGVKSLLFSRIAEKEVKYGEYYKGGKKNIEKLLYKNQLFLSKAAENNPISLKDPYLFFVEKLRVFPFLEDYHESNLSRLYVNRLAESKDSLFAKRFNKLICALDTGICGINAVEINWENMQIPDNIPEEVKANLKKEYKYDVRTIHSVYENKKLVDKTFFNLEEESSGTKSLFVVAGIILDALETVSNKIIDEFEKTMHQDITRYLIRLFHNPTTNPKNAQLIFATHDITQLSGDNFRRDQVWFTEKDEFGGSRLIRCSEIKGLRLGIPLDKWYSSGKLGALPLINDSDFLIEMQENNEA